MAIYSWFTHLKWWFLIVMLFYQRVTLWFMVSTLSCVHPYLGDWPWSTRNGWPNLLDTRIMHWWWWWWRYSTDQSMMLMILMIFSLSPQHNISISVYKSPNCTLFRQEFTWYQNLTLIAISVETYHLQLSLRCLTISGHRPTSGKNSMYSSISPSGFGIFQWATVDFMDQPTRGT